MGDEEDEFSFAPKVVYEKPSNQLELTNALLNKQITRNLSWRDPNYTTNNVKFSYREWTYKPVATSDDAHLAIHFQMDGFALFADSEAGERQLAAEEAKRKAQEKLEQEKKVFLDNPELVKFQKKDDDEDDNADGVVEKNQFNYFSKGCQTFTRPMKDLYVSTVQPLTANFQATVGSWEIYDTYVTALEREAREAKLTKRTKRRKKGSANLSSGKVDQGRKPKVIDPMSSSEMARCLRLMERMVNHNLEHEIYTDFKYWEDASDQYRDGTGSVLPLWRFASESTRSKHVTCLRWHPKFADLFAVSYGSYDFMRQGSGLIYCYSLKNTACPEQTFNVSSGVMCIDWHPTHHSLLCAGCYDGTVLVFDVQQKSRIPIYKSTVKSGKHTDPVWDVIWQNDEDLSKEANFVSVSSDGKVASWSLLTSRELNMEVLMELKLLSNADRASEFEDETVVGLAGGCSLDFNKCNDHLFLVGTEEGKVHKCSKAYSAEYLETFVAHAGMAVYSVRCNEFHPNIFISCSADWTIKLWDHTAKTGKPLMTFELGEAVGDICWSSYSSTVFAAVTSAGKIHVFDLRENKHEPLCEQKVAKAKLTRVRFSRNRPILLVGDERGSVLSLKLSPNLRKDWKMAPFEKEAVTAEVEALNAALADVF